MLMAPLMLVLLVVAVLAGGVLGWILRGHSKKLRRFITAAEAAAEKAREDVLVEAEKASAAVVNATK